MSPPDDDLERQLSEALADRANRIEPADPNSLDHIEQRIAEEHRAMSNRRRLFIGLGAAAALVVIVGAVVLLRDDDKQSVNVVPAASSSEPESTTTSTSTTTVPVRVVPHIWPYEGSTTFSTPEDAARSFAVDYLGMTNARLGAPTGNNTASKVEVFPNARGNARTTVVLENQSGADWVVTGAIADQIVVETPQPHDPVTSPITVSGQGTAFEAQLGVELRPLGSKSAVATGTAMAGANGEMGPFTTTIGPPSTDQPVVLIVFEGDASGEQTYTYATVVLLGA